MIPPSGLWSRLAVRTISANAAIGVVPEELRNENQGQSIGSKSAAVNKNLAARRGGGRRPVEGEAADECDGRMTRRASVRPAT
jgi:hypothetical protein